MQDQLRKRLAVIREVQNGNRRQRAELHRQLQQFQLSMKSGKAETSLSMSLGDGVPTDPRLEQQNAVEASLTTIINLNQQLDALETELTAQGDLLIERLQILQQCRIDHPEYVPPEAP